MNEPRDRGSRPPDASSRGENESRDEPYKPNEKEDLVPALPEEADEIFELVDDESDTPLDVAAEEASESLEHSHSHSHPTSTRKRRPTGAPHRDVPPERLQGEVREMQAKLERKDQQIEQIMEAYRGQKAETEKLRHRIEKTERRRFEQSKGDFIERFVEVLDNLDRAIDSIESAFDPDAVLQGIMLVRFRLVQLLKEEGLEKIFVKGQPFDPTHSEAAGMETVDDESQDGVVVKELERGYMLKGSLLRAARVVVGRYDGGGQSAATPKSGASSSSVPPESSSKPAGSNESSTAPDAGELPALPEFPEYQDVIENLEELELIELEPDPDPDPGPDTDTDTKTSSSDSASDSTTQAEREPSTRKEQAGATAWTNGESGSDEEAALDFTEDGLDFASKN